jgi:hypothetical protein
VGGWGCVSTQKRKPKFFDVHDVPHCTSKKISTEKVIFFLKTTHTLVSGQKLRLRVWWGWIFTLNSSVILKMGERV